MAMKPFDFVVVAVALFVIALARRDYRRGLLSERLVIVWVVGACLGTVLAVFPESFVDLFRRVGVVNYPSAPFTLAILFLFIAAYGLARKVGKMSQTLRQLAVYEAVRQVRDQAAATEASSAPSSRAESA